MVEKGLLHFSSLHIKSGVWIKSKAPFVLAKYVFLQITFSVENDHWALAQLPPLPLRCSRGRARLWVQDRLGFFFLTCQ